MLNNSGTWFSNDAHIGSWTGFPICTREKTWLEHVHGHVGFQMSVCLELMLVSVQSNGVTL